MPALAGVSLLVAAAVIAALWLGGAGSRPSGPKAAATRPGLSAPAAPATSAGPAASAAGSLRPLPSPSPSDPAQPHDPLGTAAASFLAGRTGTVLAAVSDLHTGRTWYLGRGQPQDEASVVKLDVLETLLSEQGRSGTGLPATEQELAGQMIEDSDNDAANSMWDQVGGASGIRSFNTAAGLTGTTPSSCVNCPGFPWPGWGLSTTTAADQLALLRALIEPNSALTAAERSYALSLMENVTPDQRWGVSGGVPAQATVALKNGWLPLDSAGDDWQINSVGWVSGGGRDYLIAVLSTGNPSEQYGIDTIGQLAAMVWNTL
jgi:hypothetical protein